MPRDKDIISLAIGSPDMPPSKQTIDKLCEVANNPNAHGYQPTVGIPELRKAMAGFYKRWYDVDLDWATEIQPLIGSKEGILHVTLAFCNPGDEVLIPNPGYPTYTAINKILGTKITYYDLREDNGWQPDFDALEKMDLSHVKLMWTNYPNMPTGGVAKMETYERAGGVCQEAQHRGGERQPLFAHPQRASDEHHAGAGSQGLLHRVQFAEQEPQHAGMACGDDFEQQDFHLLDSEGEEQHRQRMLPRYTAGCCRGDAQQYR